MTSFDIQEWSTQFDALIGAFQVHVKTFTESLSKTEAEGGLTRDAAIQEIKQDFKVLRENQFLNLDSIRAKYREKVTSFYQTYKPQFSDGTTFDPENIRKLMLLVADATRIQDQAFLKWVALTNENGQPLPWIKNQEFRSKYISNIQKHYIDEKGKYFVQDEIPYWNYLIEQIKEL